MLETLSALLAFILGAVLGSFLNVVILRSREVNPAAASHAARSQCPKCRRTLTVQELVPILSFVWLRGKCRTCQARISYQYPLVELGLGIITLLLFTPLPTTGMGYAAAVLLTAICAVLIVLIAIDWHTFLLPDRYVLTLAGLVVGWLLLTSHSFDAVRTAGIGAGIGAGFLGFLWLITRGQGIGLGDVKLMVPLGALLGVGGTITLFFIAFTAGGLWGIYLLLRTKAHLKTAIPFGPYLAGAAILLILFPVIPPAFLQLIWNV